jgi:hypothetical protein
MKKAYKTQLCRMKVATFTERLVSGNLGFRVRGFLNGQLSAVVGEDGWIHFSRV